MIHTLLASPWASFGQHLQVLVGQQRLIRLGGVDRVEHGGDGLRLALGPQHRGLPVGLRPQHGGLPLALGAQDAGLPVAGRRQDLRLPLALGQQHLGALLALGAGALLHRVADGGGGSIERSSTRLTLMPHLPVASSRTVRSFWLMSSRLVRVSSRSMPPMMLRSVVW
jgi:hypothetical protein